MNIILDDNDGKMIPGDECGPNFLTFVLQLDKNPLKTLNKETDSSGDPTQARCVRGLDLHTNCFSHGLRIGLC